MAESEEIRAARRVLGQQLARYRQAAGLSQHQLAPRIHYGRSTIANVEVGRQNVPRDLWARCDDLLGANGALLQGCDELQALAARQRWEAARRDVQAATTGALAAAVPTDDRLGSVVTRQTMTRPGPEWLRLRKLAIYSATQIDEIIIHLREQWHWLVKTDNLLGPRFALEGVRDQLVVIEALLSTTLESRRQDVAQLASQYAESAAWLYEDSGNLALARYWTGRALELAYEADDRNMLAWTVFRRSQQAGRVRDVVQVIGLAQTARRDEDRLPSPMRAAIRVQEAQGHAMNRDERTAQQLLEEAHTWAVADTAGDARGGHGSFCTPGYIEVQRAVAPMPGR